MSTTPHRSLLRSIGLSAATAALAVAAAGCGSDDDTLSASACDAYADAQAAFFGDPAQLGAAFTAFADAAPDDLADEARGAGERGRRRAPTIRPRSTSRRSPSPARRSATPRSSSATPSPAST